MDLGRGRRGSRGKSGNVTKKAKSRKRCDAIPRSKIQGKKKKLIKRTGPTFGALEETLGREPTEI